MYIYICIFICIYIYMCVCVCVRACVRACVRGCERDRKTHVNCYFTSGMTSYIFLKSVRHIVLL